MCAQASHDVTLGCFFYSPTPRCNRRASCRPCQRPGGNKERRLTATKQCPGAPGLHPPVFPPCHKELCAVSGKITCRVALMESRVAMTTSGTATSFILLSFIVLFKSKYFRVRLARSGTRTEAHTYRSVSDTRYTLTCVNGIAAQAGGRVQHVTFSRTDAQSVAVNINHVKQRLCLLRITKTVQIQSIIIRPS